MPFSKRHTVLIIFLIGLLCVMGNLWVTLNRSTMPRSFDNRVVKKEIGHEKHPGKDDVNWLILDNGEKIHVDSDLWKELQEGDQLKKDAWEVELHHGQKNTDETSTIIRLSPDFQGMVGTMLFLLIVLVVIARKSNVKSVKNTKM